MAAPAHYIRSIHTSFTAAHPPSSAWSSAARGSQLHVANHTHEGMSLQPGHHSHHQHQREVLPSQQRTASYSQGPYSYNALVHAGGGVSINTHNHHSYTHHLQNLGQPAHHHHQGYSQGGRSSGGGQGQGQGYRKTPPGLTSTAGGPAASAAGAGGRRRSVSIRVAPTSYAPPAYKFDPFADEPILPSGGSGGSGAAALSVTSPLTSSSQANKGPSQWSNLQLQSAEPYAEEAASAAAPYTIHIPAAAPLDIQQYSPPVRPAARLRSLTPVSSPASIPTTVASPSLSAASQAQAQARSANLSKIVAGMLLNRAHSIGRPMRRRVLPRLVEGAPTSGYRKSCLSSVISVEA